MVVLTSGFAAWFFESSGSVGAGASGVVFGYFGYIIVRGLFDRRAIDVIIGAVMALCFAYQFSVLLPHQGIGWQAHVGGVVGGVLSGGCSGTGAPRPSCGRRSRPAVPASPAPGSAAKPAKSAKKGPAVDPANPRADLYKQLDDLGL